VPRGTMSSLKELELRIRKWRTQTPREVNNRAKTQEPYNQQGRVRLSRVESKRLNRLRRGLSDERVNNNFCPIQSVQGCNYAGVQQSVEWHSLLGQISNTN
jgi:hypothetical protein